MHTNTRKHTRAPTLLPRYARTHTYAMLALPMHARAQGDPCMQPQHTHITRTRRNTSMHMRAFAHCTHVCVHERIRVCVHPVLACMHTDVHPETHACIPSTHICTHRAYTELYSDTAELRAWRESRGKLPVGSAVGAVASVRSPGADIAGQAALGPVEGIWICGDPQGSRDEGPPSKAGGHGRARVGSQTAVGSSVGDGRSLPGGAWPLERLTRPAVRGGRGTGRAA